MRSGILLLALLAACARPAEGLRLTPEGDGPTVTIDWDAEPLPELPFPNDLSTIADASSPTGLRLNIPTKTRTEYEHHTRVKLDELTGFGVYQPISVGFEAPLDLDNIVARHPDDFETSDPFADDAFYLIDVTPGSPDYGKPVALDVGHGRYPYDVMQPDRYFSNDPRAGEPSLIFETADEDLNGNGEIDPGEDTDGDGILDVPNVYPVGGDPFEDLLTFYERETNSLVVRPVMPLREETTYAMVLTSRLIGEDGNPIRSPWEYVNHTRQTHALEPLRDILPEFGLSTDDVAYAWTFTTGRITGDLRDLHAALFDGTGPYRKLHDAIPMTITEATQIHAQTTSDQWNLPETVLSTTLPLLGLASGEGVNVIIDSYDAFADRMVGGAFITTNLLTDVDDGGSDTSDEWWKLNPATGEVVQTPLRVAFNCIVPKAVNGFKQPFQVGIYGHGYGSSRVEFIAWAGTLARFGIAACSMDSPGHGATLGKEELQSTADLLALTGLTPFMHNLFDSRARDLNNDGELDSGADQWVADPFHTRDQVRQQVLDWMTFTRALQNCGTGTMQLTGYDENGHPFDTGGTRATCDWDDDGVPDIGGPGNKFTMFGGSLGGINAGVAAAVIPEISAFVPVVPGGGIADVGIRTEIGGAVEAFVGRLLNPLLIGYADGDGVRVTQMAVSITDMKELTVDRIPSIPAGGHVELYNERTGEMRQAPIFADGHFRVGILADAMNATDKRKATGMPDSGPVEGAVYEIAHNKGLGDPLTLEVYDADGNLVREISSWSADVVHEGITMRVGSPLVAMAEGNGELRGSPTARRLATVSAMVLEGGDPIAYARHYTEDPFQDLGGKPTNVLLMPTIGDPWVTINTGVALARAAGVVDWQHVDDRYGMTVDQWLIDRQVIRGVEERGPWRDTLGNPILFDPDDLDDGTDDFGAPSDAPLRATLTSSAGMSGLRMPYVEPTGIHGFSVPEPERAFDISSYAVYLIGSYLASGGTKLEDRPCMEDGSCSDFPPFPAVVGVQ